MHFSRYHRLWALLALLLSLGFVRYLSAQPTTATATFENWLLVGDSGHGDKGQAQFFVWEDSQWVLKQTVTPSDSDATQSFGATVALDGDRAVIGATLHEGPDSAQVDYVLRFNGSQWQEEEVLVVAGGPTPTPIQPTPSPIVIDPDEGTQPDVIVDPSGYIFGCSHSPRTVAKFDIELFMAFVLAFVFFGLSKYRSRSRNF